MKDLLKTPVGRLRVIGFLEGISLLLLMFIAMPLKYFADQPLWVTYIGWVHGFLFIFFMLMLLNIYLERNWSVWKLLLGFLASLLPFGTFLFDAKLKREDMETRMATEQQRF